MSEPGTAGPN